MRDDGWRGPLTDAETRDKLTAWFADPHAALTDDTFDQLNLLCLLASGAKRWLDRLADDEWWEKQLAEYDTFADSALREANPDVWAAIKGSEMISCIPDSEPDSLAMRHWLRGYARRVSRAVAKLFNPDCSLKEMKREQRGGDGGAG